MMRKERQLLCIQRETTFVCTWVLAGNREMCTQIQICYSSLVGVLCSDERKISRFTMNAFIFVLSISLRVQGHINTTVVSYNVSP